jgi:protein gp37
MIYQCEQQEVAFFFKQWGGWGADGKKRAKKQNGRLLEGRTWNALPEGPHILRQHKKITGENDDISVDGG